MVIERARIEFTGDGSEIPWLGSGKPDKLQTAGPLPLTRYRGSAGIPTRSRRVAGGGSPLRDHAATDDYGDCPAGSGGFGDSIQRRAECPFGSHRGSHWGSMGECVSVKSVPCVRLGTLLDSPPLSLQAGGRGFESHRLHAYDQDSSCQNEKVF